MDLPLVSGTLNNTKNMPNILNIVNSQKVLKVPISDTNIVKYLVTKITKSQLDVQTIEQATPTTIKYD